MNDVLVSVIVPCYNQGQYLSETLDSVLAQSYPHWECIIVNDGSTDDSSSIAHDYENKDERFHVIDKINEGPAITRNIGIKASSGRYILPLDADDMIAPTYIEKAISYLEHHPTTKLVYCGAMFCGDQSGEWILPDYDYYKMIWKNSIFCSAVYRRKDYDMTNGYNPNMRYGYEDWDFWLSLLTPEDVVYKIPEILFYYRRHCKARTTDTQEHIWEMNTQLIENHISIYKPYLGGMMRWKKETEYYKKELDKILQSKSYKIGRTMLLPFRWIKDTLKRDDM